MGLVRPQRLRLLVLHCHRSQCLAALVAKPCMRMLRSLACIAGVVLELVDHGPLIMASTVCWHKECDTHARHLNRCAR